MFQISQKESRLFFMFIVLYDLVEPLTTSSVFINRLTMPLFVSFPSMRLISSCVAVSHLVTMLIHTG